MAEETRQPSKSSETTRPKMKRRTFHLHAELNDKVTDYADYYHLTIIEAMEQILTEFFADKNIPPTTRLRRQGKRIT